MIGSAPPAAPRPRPAPEDVPSSAAGPGGVRPAPRRGRVTTAAVLLPAALLAVVAVHLGLGASGVGTGDIVAHLLGRPDPFTGDVLVGSRLPRTLTGLVVGAALGVAGALLQGATRNPLAAPDTLGVNGGAYLAVVAVAFTGVSLGPLPAGAAAFLGGLAAMSVVHLLTRGGVLTAGRVLLAGATVALATTACAAFLQILDTQATQGLFFWGNGTLLQSDLTRPLVIGALVLVLACCAPLLARPLDLLALGDETARAMGVRVERIRPATLLLAVVLSAAAVSLAGPIGFVGLIAPVALRSLGIRAHAALLPLSALLAAVVVLAADSAAQLAFPASAGHGELPVGIVTALIGGPVFMLLARRVRTGDADTGAAVVVGDGLRRGAYAVFLGGALLTLAGAVLLGLRIGDADVGWADVGAFAVGLAPDGVSGVLEYRLPRVTVAALAGACLALAGTAVQSVVRNPLAEPSLIGVTGGASLGAVFVIAALPAAPLVALPLAAAVGGVAALAVVVLVARGPRDERRRAGLDPTRVVLVGLGASATATALVNVLVVGSQMNIAGALTWLAGSTYAKDATALGWLAVPAVVAVLLVLAARAVDLLALGDELPRALGMELGRVRLLVLGAGAVMAAGTAAAVGAVGFVGLLAPHLARRLVGTGTLRVAPVAALLGATLVVVADALGRWLLAPVEIPVGIVTAVIGAPYLIWLLRRRGNA